MGTTLLELLADPNVSTLVISGLTGFICWVARGHGAISVPANVRPVIAAVLPAIHDIAAHKGRLDAHTVLDDILKVSQAIRGVPAAPKA